MTRAESSQRPADDGSHPPQLKVVQSHAFLFAQPIIKGGSTAVLHTWCITVAHWLCEMEQQTNRRVIGGFIRNSVGESVVP